MPAPVRAGTDRDAVSPETTPAVPFRLSAPGERRPPAQTSVDAVLHRPVEPIEQGTLAVGALHRLHWEVCGRADGLPALFLHGGPGAGISPLSRRFFDPDRYRVVLFDQRGAGRSTPRGDTRENTTGALIEDIERLRRHLAVDRWLLFGGSWGSTLALAYAQAHPERCLGLVLRGVWLGSEEEIAWWLYGMRQFFPAEWEAFAGQVGADERGDLLRAYRQRLQSDDPAIHGPAARAWSRYEGACLHLLPQPATAEAFAEDAFALSLARLEAHYFHHRAFLRPGQLLDGMPRIRHLPAAIVQGRYDVVCPVRYAHALAAAWPQARFEVVPDAGHSSHEPGIAAALVRATDVFARHGHFAA